MQQVPTESPEQYLQSSKPFIPTQPTQDGSHHHDPSILSRARPAGSPSSASPSSVRDPRRDSLEGVNPDHLDEKLRGLSLGPRAGGRPPAPGQRISDYEKALTPPTPKQALGFKVIKRSDGHYDGTQIEDFPNGQFPNSPQMRWHYLTLCAIEILTHILSHLHPDSHAAVALVSKRFYALMTTPYAWRMAFLRYFPAHTALENKRGKNTDGIWKESSSDIIRSETRYFARLTPLATWRSEYLFRTRLIRSLERGKPGAHSGGIGSSARTRGKRISAVLTYNSKLPWLVTNIHAVFSNGKKPPRVIQGASELGVGTISDPTSGKIEKWGLEDPVSFPQLDEVMPNLVPYGLGEGPAALPNVMDVSQPYGILGGEGFPGGRPFFRAATEMRGRYLGAETGVVDTYPDIPKIPEMSEAISSVWLAKSSAVPATTHSMVGMLTGSTLGVVTAYSLGWDASGPRYSNGDMTARWVLSPGVPIVSLKVDGNFNVKRKSTARVWVVALNALGEVFYLTQTPTNISNNAKGEDVVKNAWHAGRTVYWHILEATRRVARPDDLDKNAIRGTYSPRSPSDSMNLNKNQMAAEAREIEKFLRYKPAHFIKVCEGWDMRRKLEVDFANDDGKGAGEGIFVIDCGLAEGRPACIQRFSRSKASRRQQASAQDEQPSPPSLFGPVNGEPVVSNRTPESQSPRSPPPTPLTPGVNTPATQHEWSRHVLQLKGHACATITASALDCSSHSTLALSEDPLYVAGEVVNGTTDGPNQGPPEIPGRRARFLVVGTKSGALLVWNVREDAKSSDVEPVRIIQTDSPEVSCVAATALYLVHGGSDGLVQAWDPLASTTGAIRTLNARSNGRVPRHMMTMNPALPAGNYSAAGAIYLDPDPTVLRGVVSFGAFMRYWAYSSTSTSTGRKRRLRHSDIHGRIASRRQGGTSSRYIAAEEAELRRENEQRAREQSRLRKRFGVGELGDLTEEEALRYVQMVSEEAYLLEEQRRASDSAAEASLDTASSFSETTADTVTSEPSVTGASQSAPPATDDESDYEQQIQAAIRLSLLEGVNDVGQSPRGNSSGEYEFSVKYKPKGGKKGKNSASGSGSPSASHTPINPPKAGTSNQPPMTTEDDDLALALSLSMQDQGQAVSVNGQEQEDFPSLETEGIGKGKGVCRW